MIRLMKIDTQDKIRVLDIYTDGGDLVRESGEWGGKLITHRRACKGKNIGRSNETTAAMQAALEMASKVKEKIRGGYVELPLTQPEPPSNGQLRRFILANRTQVPMVMLAKTYNDKHADYMNGVLISPKLDGIRCIAIVSTSGVELYSRGGLEITTMDHIKKALEPMTHWVGTPVILDGELYYHSKADENFQCILKSFKKYRAGYSEKLRYCVFDMIDTSMNALRRWYFYQPLVDRLDTTSVMCLPQVVVSSKSKVLRADDEHIKQGYEGTIVKNAESMYVPDLRSSDMLKLKQFQESEYVIVDVIPMDNQPESGKAVMASPKGEFHATPAMNMGERAEFLRNKQKYIGLKGTVRHQGFTDKGLPRIASLKSIDRKAYEGV